MFLKAVLHHCHLYVSFAQLVTFAQHLPGFFAHFQLTQFQHVIG